MSHGNSIGGSFPPIARQKNHDFKILVGPMELEPSDKEPRNNLDNQGRIMSIWDKQINAQTMIYLNIPSIESRQTTCVFMCNFS
jgi:hypothetical protein